MGHINRAWTNLALPGATLTVEAAMDFDAGRD